jgi:phosphohistidine phosphatase
MDAYLVQHGEALSEAQDPQRPLSVEGRAAVAKMGDYLTARASRLITQPILEVRHSGRLRAMQTAEILAHTVCPQAPLKSFQGMNPNDPPQIVYEELVSSRVHPGVIMLVGHLPHLARVAGLLLAGSADNAPIQFVNAGVVKIRATESHWAVEWYVTPACVP